MERATQAQEFAGEDSRIAGRQIQFSGLGWEVKRSGPGKRVGPGPNYFGDSDQNVFLDERGRLHLKITRQRDAENHLRWFCSEVICTNVFGGYGTYRWFLDTPVGADTNVVLGLFTWDNTSAEEHHREIDIELISTWGDADSGFNAQYVLQPWDVNGRRKRWRMPTTEGITNSTHSFTWHKDNTEFLSVTGHSRTNSAQSVSLQSWNFHGREIPSPGNEQVRMNLWLLERLPSDAREPEVVISRFEFVPGIPENVVPKTSKEKD